MWPFPKRFLITGFDGKIHFFTAQKIYKQAINTINSDYKFFAPASELIRVCSLKDFPTKYADEIKLAILDCFANLENTSNRPPYLNESNTIYHCYNSLTSESEQVTDIKKKYVRAIINNVAKHHFSLIEFNYSGPTYNRLCEEWKEKCFQEFFGHTIDFVELRRTLHANFDKIMRDAEAQGLFKADYDTRFSNMYFALSQLKRGDKEENQ